MKHLAYLSVALLIVVLAACSTSENEPNIPTQEETQSTETDPSDGPNNDNEIDDNEINNPTTGETPEALFLTQEEFKELVMGRYWYLKESSFHYADGNLFTDKIMITGNYGLLALYIAPEGNLNEYQAFTYKCFNSNTYEYDDETGILSSPTSVYGYYKIHKVEDGNLYISYKYDKTIPDEASGDFMAGSYTYSTFAPATNEQIQKLLHQD
ncbi:MAG: hypothetical protein NC217_00590 [Muribaculaceae bacterium]|nr:hypothetical protein [Muribaculaceae bacterium]